MYALQHEVLGARRSRFRASDGRLTGRKGQLPASMTPGIARRAGDPVAERATLIGPIGHWDVGGDRAFAIAIAPSAAAQDRGAEGKAEPARRRVAAHCRHHDYPRLQPAGRPRTGAVRKARALRPHLVPGRGRCDDDRGVDEGDVRGPGTARRQVLGVGRAWSREVDRHLQQAGERLSHPLPGGPGCHPDGGHTRTGSHMETLAFYFPVVDGHKGELALHWGTVLVPMSSKCRELRMCSSALSALLGCGRGPTPAARVGPHPHAKTGLRPVAATAIPSREPAIREPHPRLCGSSVTPA